MIIVKSKPRAVLLDTCAVIFVFNGEPVAPDVVNQIEAAGRNRGVYISPISAWEIALLSVRQRPDAPSFAPDARSWFAAAMSAPMVQAAVFNSDIAFDSALLPPIHKDPADRLLIATARHLGIPIVTRDRVILDYATAGHVDAILC